MVKALGFHVADPGSNPPLTSGQNRLFPNYSWPRFQSEAWCSSFHMKISFHLHAREN